MSFHNVDGVQASAPPPFNPAYSPERRSSALSRTIAMIAIVAFSLIAAAAVDYDAPPLALMLRIVAGVTVLTWLFSRSRPYRQVEGYHGDYHPEPSVVVVQEPYRQVHQQQPSVVVVQQDPPRRRNSWGGGFGNLFSFGSQPMYVAPQTRGTPSAPVYQQPPQGGYANVTPPVARAPAQQYGSQSMHRASQQRDTPRPPVYQQPSRGGYNNGAPPVYRAPAQESGGQTRQTMHVAPETRASVYPSAPSYQAPAYNQTPPAAYSAPPQNHGGYSGSQTMYQAPKDRNK